MSIIFSRILNLLFNIPKVLSIDILVLDCIKLNVLCILALHLFHFGRENKTMATLDKEHLLSTYKVRICPSSNISYIYFLEKNPIMDLLSPPPLTIIPKIAL